VQQFLAETVVEYRPSLRESEPAAPDADASGPSPKAQPEASTPLR
jgi:hypothetical protein